MPVNIILAVLLSLLTFLITYSAWYIVRGKAKKERLKAKSTGKDNPEVLQGKYTKNSYCYPKINEVMGYDFVTVVGIPEELRKGPVKKEPNWADSKGIGFTGAVTGVQNESPEDELYPETGAETSQRPEKPMGKPLHSAPAKTEKEEQQEQTEVLPGAYGLSQKEMDALNNMADWTNRDLDLDRGDEYWDNMLNENEDMIDNEGEISPEDLQTAREQEALLAIKQMEDIFDDQETYANDAGEIMREVQNQ